MLFLQHNHLVGLKKKYLKLSFNHVDDLSSVRKDLNRSVRKNKERMKGTSSYQKMLSRLVVGSLFFETS